MAFSKAILAQTIRTVPNFPKPGILFRDIAPIFLHADVFAMVVDELCARIHPSVDVIATIDARGFLCSSAVAYALRKPLAIIRKQGKLPGETISTSYALEYGTNTLEIQRGAISTGTKTVVMDDLIATGGTLLAAIHLIQSCGGIPTHVLAMIDLPALGGSTTIASKHINVDALLSY